MHKYIQTALRLINSQKGFALIAAIMACLILFALGTLVIALSTQDIRVSVKIVGDKRSLASAEEGISNLCQTFDPAAGLVAPQQFNRADLKSIYTINYPAVPLKTGPGTVPLAGYSVDMWGLSIYNIDVAGRSTEYNTQVTIGVGVGYFANVGTGYQ
jgi:hypothetical protein